MSLAVDHSPCTDASFQQPSKQRRIADIPVNSLCPSSMKDPGAMVAYLSNEAGSLFDAGDFQKASQLLEHAITLTIHRKDVKGERLTLQKSEAVAPPATSYIYQRLDFDEGLDVYADLEQIDASMNTSAVTATLLFNAGQTRQRLDDANGAMHMYRQALHVLLPDATLIREQNGSSAAPIAKAVHSVAVPILHRLALSSYRRGMLNDAIDFYEQALCHARRLHGPTDLSVGLTLNCLGVIKYHLGCDDSCGAATYFEDALAVLVSKLGSESLLVATALNNLGRVWVQREEFSTAYRHYLRALSIRAKVLGRDHLDTAASSFNTAQSLHQQGELDQAMALYRDFLRVARLKLSKDHRDVAVVLSGIAQILQEKKEYDEALRLYTESIRVGRAALGEYHSEVSILYNRLGNFFYDQGRFDDALKAYKDGLRIERRVFKTTHPNIAVTLSNIGEIYRQQRDYTRSIKLYCQALKLQRAKHGVLSTEVAGTLSVIGLIHDQRGDTSIALNYLQESLIVKRTMLGDNHLEVASTLMHLGSLLYRRNMISASLDLFAEAQRIRSNKLGADDRDVSFSTYNIGLCLHLRGDYKQAAACYRETLRVERLVLGEDHRDVALTYSKLGEALKSDGDLDGALHCFESALRIEKKSCSMGGDSAFLVRALNEIGNLHLALGNIHAMMDAFSDVARTAGHSIDSVIVSPTLKIYAAGFEKAAAAA
jgi:tetratricopeptide (TPR) repeat protein